MAARRAKGPGAAELVFVPLGGVGEIGMNCYLYGYGPPDDRRWLMVDLGVTFPGSGEPGVDVIMPDLRFIIGERRSLEGLVLTHAHEDHLGAVIDLWPELRVPIFATPFTAGLLKAKLNEERPGSEIPVKVVPLRSRLTIGPFEIELVDMAHSIPETSGLAIRAGGSLVFHTADWKLDASPVAGAATDLTRIEELGREGLTALICDSTNALRDGISPSESEVGETLKRLIKEARQRVAVTLFASNVGRIRAVMEAAAGCGREVVLAGRAVHRVVQVAQETGYLSPKLRYLDQDAFLHLRRDKVVAIATGSQGEPRAALARIAQREHPAIALAAGDTVIFSSRPIPGNEEAIGKVLNGLADQGVRLITDGDDLVHVTGHPRRGELNQLFALCRPQCLIPMHGEARHLEAQGRIAKDQGNIPEILQVRNGRMARLAMGDTRIIDEVPVGRLYRDGKILVSSDGGPVKARRKLSFVGIVVISLVFGRGGDLLADPEIALDGIPQETPSGPMDELILNAVEGAVDSIPRARRKDADRLKEAVARAARAAVAEAWGKKPICKVLLTMLRG
jgi:ribonuclease J